VQIIDGHVITSINVEWLVDCTFLCKLHEQCNAFRLILNETVMCEQNTNAQRDNLDVSNDMLEAC